MSSSMKSASTSKKASFSPTISFMYPDGMTNPSTQNGPSTPSSISSRSKASYSSSRKLTTNTIYTPITTPLTSIDDITHHDEASLMLLPPSQTISESLTALAASTAASLEKVWDEVGYSPEERATQLSDLLQEFRNLCFTKVEQERRVAEVFRQTIADAKEEFRLTCKALKIDVDESLVKDNNGQMTLQDELTNVETALEKVRSNAQVATEDLIDCRDALLQAHEALGLELDETWCDITSDLTQARRDAFHTKVEETKVIISTRTMAIVQLLKDCKDLIELLRIDYTSNSLDRKIMSSLTKDKDGLVTTRSAVDGESYIGISSEALNALTVRVGELHGEKRRRKAKIAEMGVLIAELWEKLHVPREEQEKFAGSISSIGVLSMETIEKGEKELQRLYRLKSDMMGKLVWEAREKIHQLWDETGATDELKSKFNLMKIKDESAFTDELLTEHEHYIEVLQQRLDLMRPIIVLIEKREEIISERMEYEELQKDPERLQQRGSALTKQLMKEEKMSKRIKKDLPRYTEHLEKRISDWEDAHGDPFLYKGEPYLIMMKRQDEEWLQYKENQNQMKLKKKQEELGVFHPLVQKKKEISGSSQRIAVKSAGPLSDGTNKPRATSRGRANGMLQPEKPSDSDALKTFQLQRSTSNGRSRPITRP